MFPKTLIIISLSRSYTHGGEKIKQTHVPVPAALELRRAVVAKVKAHYSYARKRCGIILVFLWSDDLLLLWDVFCFFSCVGLQQQTEGKMWAPFPSYKSIPKKNKKAHLSHLTLAQKTGPMSYSWGARRNFCAFTSLRMLCMMRCRALSFSLCFEFEFFWKCVFHTFQTHATN